MTIEQRARIAAQQVMEETGVAVYVDYNVMTQAVSFSVKDVTRPVFDQDVIILRITEEGYARHDADAYVHRELVGAIRGRLPAAIRGDAL